MRARHRHFNPRDVGAKFAFDARFLSGFADNAAVDTWTGRSGAITATQSIIANRPVYVASAINGQPSVKFDGSNDNLIIDSGPSVSSANAFAVIAVSRLLSHQLGGNYPNILHLPSNEANQNWRLFYSNDSNYRDLSFGAGATGSATWARLRFNQGSQVTGFRVISVAYDGVSGTSSSSYGLNVDGQGRTLSGSGNYSTLTGNGRIGAEGHNNYQTHLTGDVCAAAVVEQSHKSIVRRLEHAAAYSFKLACS